MSDDQGDRLTPTGDDARALRHMVRELSSAPGPRVDWERVEARLFERIDAEDPAVAPRIVRGPEEAEPAGGGVPAARASRGGSNLRERAHRQTRGRWLGAWAAVAAVLVAGAAFAWVERMGQVVPAPPVPAPEAVAAPGPALPDAPAAAAPGGQDGRVPDEAPVVAPEEAPREVAPQPRSAPHASTGTPAPDSAGPPPVAHAPTAPEASAPTSERDLTQRLLACIEQRRAAERAAPRDGVEAVVVEIRSQLVLRVGAEGGVEAARFQPPLRPELQSCAVSALRAQLAPGEREVHIPIVLR